MVGEIVIINSDMEEIKAKLDRIISLLEDEEKLLLNPRPSNVS